MTSISQVIVYMYAETATSIHQLKMQAYKSKIWEEFRYRMPDGFEFWSDRYRPEYAGIGWTYEKKVCEKVECHMGPRHELWKEYKNRKRRATLLLAARLILKANNEIVPDKEQVGPLLAMKIFRSHARTSSAQKTLAYAAFRYLRKLENRLRNQPQRFDHGSRRMDSDVMGVSSV